MSDLLDTYEKDFEYTSQSLAKALSDIASQSGENRLGLLREAESSLDELKEIIGSMDAEVLSLPLDSRASYNAKLRGFKSQLMKHETLLKKYEDEDDRAQLFGSRAATGGFGDSDQRQSLLMTNALLARALDRLRESQRVANETENVGANILNNLRGQREQLVNSHNTLMEADGYVDKSIRTLRTMSRRMAANKMLSYGIIAILIILIFLVLVSKFR